MTIVLSDEDDDVPLDALVQQTDPQEESSENKNNNANSNSLNEAEVIPTVELSSEDDTSSSSSSRESRAEDLLKEINAEDKRKNEEKRIIREEASCPLPPDGVKTPPPFPTTGSFVLRKETIDDDQSKSDMDCDSEDDQPEKPIEVNVKIPIAMQPRTLRRPTPTGMIGPKRVPIGKFTTVKSSSVGPRKSSPEESARSMKKGKIKMNTEPIEIEDDGFALEKFDDEDSQKALDEIMKDVNKYKLDTKLSSEATYWMTLVEEGVCKWSNTEVIDEFIDKLQVPVVENEEELNNTAIAEIMGEIQKKSVNEQVAGVGAWKKRAKIDNMFVARTLKNQILTGLKFDQQKKQVDRRLNADRVAEEKQKEQRIKKNRRERDSGRDEVVCTGQDFAEDARVTVLPIPKDLPREERHLLERATQELLREAAAFIKGRNAKKRANFGYELGANLNADGTHRQGQTFVESNTQLQSVTMPGANASSWRSAAPQIINGSISNGQAIPPMMNQMNKPRQGAPSRRGGFISSNWAPV
ncbi:Oidioi.mRNA.OKI2018_I69.chr2.g5085.t1.cds [Oikopleura dioica]|uniref:Oidioi.mRNA.OKI2018_I69.chr2.g5085.t1.cds n=1 Tax=Oikopleura dioica TaxID=34765 RepID=A0ABN7T3P2_OIKDI|nr:Oidioi.mRNA.OKI2018_I69.chr2.g5085.t1.cds [Oikopleura dioica]